MSYTPNFGSVIATDLSHNADEALSNYSRWLDIEDATAGVTYTDQRGTRFERQYIASHPDGVIAVNFKASSKHQLSMLFAFRPGDDIDASAVSYQGHDASFGGKLTILSYAARFRVVADGGTTTATADGIHVNNANAITLYLCGATDYDMSKPTFVSGKDPAKAVLATINAAARKGYDRILTDHVKDFHSLMGRCTLSFDGAHSNVDTETLVRHYNDSTINADGTGAEALFLEQLYFAYGRYLMIASSRGVSLPSNLQGIWNNSSRPAWNCDIHSNINVQMNYWPAETTNLSSLHMAYLDYIMRMAGGDTWQRCAREAGQTVGWSCLTENNIFGGMSQWGDNYLIANAWYCSHLWQHYRYTLDRTFLRRAFPTMWGAAQFWMQRMIRDRVTDDGTWVCPDEFSPEQLDSAIIRQDATAHSQQLVSSLFGSVKEAIDILGRESLSISDADYARLCDYLEHSDSGLHTEVFDGRGDWGAWGTDKGVSVGDSLLREWKYSGYYEASEKNHRHMSHLMALYPLGQIAPGSRFFKPAVNSLRLRGDQATGWSMAWKVNLWARALDGNHAHKIIRNALAMAAPDGGEPSRGGVCFNLYDSHPPFQIDGNFGVTAGIAEMLLQSYTDTLCILPALPRVWRSGEVKGLRGVGGFQVDIKWKDFKANKIKVLSTTGAPCFVSYAGINKAMIYVDGKKQKTTAVNDKTVKIKLVKGQTAVVEL